MMALERSYSNEDEAELARSNFSARAKYGNQDLGVSQQGLYAFSLKNGNKKFDQTVPQLVKHYKDWPTSVRL